MTEKIRFVIYDPPRGSWGEWHIRTEKSQSTCDSCEREIPLGEKVWDIGHYDPGDGEKMWDARLCKDCATNPPDEKGFDFFEEEA